MYLDSKKTQFKGLWNLVYPNFFPTVNVIHSYKETFLNMLFSTQGHKSTGAGCGRPNTIEFRQRVAGFHQDVTIRGELRAGGRDDAGGSGACHRPGAHGPRHNARGTPEEDHEQRDGVTGADVRHLAGFPRVTATATSNPANGSYVENRHIATPWISRIPAYSRRPDASPPRGETTTSPCII